MKIMTVLGTRPEIIRLSLVIGLLDRYCDHVLVHTGQNYDERLSDIFFDELEVRGPDVQLGVTGSSFGAQVGSLLQLIEPVYDRHRPDRLLILGDTNSGLSAIPAARRGMPVYHMEAGNRCFDDRVPEEVNRRLIDHASTVLLPYTHNSKENLVAEGIPLNRIFVTGNPIYQVMQHFKPKIDASTVLPELGLKERRYFLATLHRAENVDLEPRLRRYLQALERLCADYDLPVVCSLHPRTRSRIEQWGIKVDESRIRFVAPLGFLDFLRLERSAFCVLSDSGTVQEECSLLGVPSVTLRDVTERPETLESGSNVVAGADPDRILRLVRFVTQETASWIPPAEYLVPNVAETVARLLLGYRLQWPPPGEVSR